MTRIALTADLHGELPEIDPCDILVIAGDIVPDFWRHPNRDQKQSKWLSKEFREWLTFDVPADNVVACAGNHDFVFQKPFLIPDDLPWTYLQDSSTTVGGIEFYGTPWVPHLPDWAFHADFGELQRRSKLIPRTTDILISHGPPFGAGDLVLRGERVGDEALADEVLRINPDLIVSGHIHEDYGEHRIAGVPVLSVSLNTVRYEPTNSVVYIDYDKKGGIKHAN